MESLRGSVGGDVTVPAVPEQAGRGRNSVRWSGVRASTRQLGAVVVVRAGAEQVRERHERKGDLSEVPPERDQLLTT